MTMEMAVDARRPVDFERMRRYRIERARAAMARHELDAVIGFEYANARYISGVRPLWAPNFMVRQAALLTAGSDEFIAFVHQDDTPHRRKTMSWLGEDTLREFPTGAANHGDVASAMRPLRDAFSELGFSGGRIGVDVATPAVLDALREVFPESTVVDGNRAMNEARIVKNEDEVELMRAASAVVDVAMEVAVASATPGTRECEVLGEVMRVFYRHGAEVPQCNLIVCSGPNTSPMQRFAGEREIREGDLVFMDIGACFEGMFSEATRTIVVGRPNEEQRAIFRTVHGIHEAVMGTIRTGATGNEVRKAVEAAIDGSPYAGTMQRMVIAHGIGIAAVEAPFIAPPGGRDDGLVLEAGMMVAVVPTLLVPDVPGGGGIRLEDVVNVTDDGPERLTQFPYDEQLLA
jgi:Xaa-Pro aminopeptidase